MALKVPSVPNPYDAANPLENAYAWTSFVALDNGAESGRLVLNVHPNEAAAQACPPILTQSYSLGQATAPGVSIGTLAELMAETTPIGSTGLTFAQCYAAISERFYRELVAKVPALAGSTIL